MSEKQVHVEVFYSPSCPFSFKGIEDIRRTISRFGDKVKYEEIDMYENPGRAEEKGFYGLLSRSIIPIFIDGKRYGGDYEKGLRKAIEEALKI